MSPLARIGDRSLFPSLEARAYLAHAAVSPPSAHVTAAITRSLEAYARRGVAAAIEHIAEKSEVRALAARLLGCEARQLGFCANTTAGVVTIARSIPFRRGDRVVVFEGEFPANVTPWQLVAKDAALDLVRLPIAPFVRSHEEGLEMLRDTLAQGVRLVAVSAVQFQTGLAMPIAAMAKLCHEHGAEIFVDAIQGLGVMPMNVEASDVDYLVSGSHKFLMGLEGVGLLYIHDRALAKLSLGLAGWLGHEDAFRFLVEEDQLRADRPLVRSASYVEQGTANMLGLVALRASLEVLLSLGIDAIFGHVTAYLEKLEPELVALGLTSARSTRAEARSASLCLRLPEGKALAQVSQHMAAQGVVASTPDGYLRFAPHFANALDEIPLVVDAVRSAL